MRKSLGFTLAEVLITLAIIGVVAAMTIPSVIVNTNQQEFKTGLKKAVSVLNQAITMNIALENVTPADLTQTGTDTHTPDSLMTYLAQRLNVIRETTNIGRGSANAAFYTSDGMRFEFPTSHNIAGLSQTGTRCGATIDASGAAIATPQNCLVVVDVNGDKRPNPNAGNAAYTFPAPNSTRISDVFTVMITDSAAIPYGAVAQRTMFQND